MCGDGRCMQDTGSCGCDDGQGGGGVVTSVVGTAPISVSTALGVATVSHDNAGTPNVYAYPASITTNATGHVTAVTAGSAPIAGIAVQEEGTPVVTSATMNFVGGGVTATNVAGVATVTVPTGAGGVTAVTATSPIVSSGGTTPNLTHANSGAAAAAYVMPDLTTDITGHITTIANGGVRVQEEGVAVVTSPTMNFVGAGVTATNVAGVATVTVPGAASVAAATPNSEGIVYGYTNSGFYKTCFGFNAGSTTTSPPSNRVACFGTYAAVGSDFADSTYIGNGCGNNSSVTSTNGKNTLVGDSSGHTSSTNVSYATGIGYAQVLDHNNSIALGAGCATTAANRLHIKSTVASIADCEWPGFSNTATVSGNTYPVVWNDSTNIMKPLSTASNAFLTGGAATSFTPTWTNITVGNGTSTGYYVQVGDLFYFWAKLEFGGTTSVDSTFQLSSLPVTAAVARTGMGSCVALDGGSYYLGQLVFNNSGGTIAYPQTADGAAAASQWATTFPVTWSSSAIIVFSGCYTV